MQWLTPFMYWVGELLQREQNMINPVDWAEAQLLANQVGQALEDLGIAIGSTAHLYWDL